ncbi:MAG: hypothetical protein QOE68_3945, partial [Thermoanaerobaculia bacterium]|nr:hypothetical protein [Thermoanaerobaculia bacterium]
ILPVVTGNRSGFTAAWIEAEQSRNKIVSVVTDAGEPIGGTGAAIEQTYVRAIAIAHSRSETLIVWIADFKVYAQRLSPSGTPLSTFAVTSGKDFAQDVGVVWDGSRYFVVWSNSYQLVGSFITPDGSSTPPRVFFDEPVVGQGAPDEFALSPNVAWDGRNFIVVFGVAPNIPCTTLCPTRDPDHFRVMRLSPDGDAIDSSPLAIAGPHFRAHVASSGAESLTRSTRAARYQPSSRATRTA